MQLLLAEGENIYIKNRTARRTVRFKILSYLPLIASIGFLEANFLTGRNDATAATKKLTAKVIFRFI